ncbi:MAG TPA: NADH:flavin oxidoreductase/NADH oxidase, partial [Pirellulales bacterium]|nr:NADH:flavin oxidoreductase/NADH oxidase [Pirellulales bacterium]
MSRLFSPLRLRELTIKNRIFVSPMCQYSSDDGLPTPWHLVHLGSRAVGGAGLVMVEATAVLPEGRITPWDSGIWSDRHGEALGQIAAFTKSAGATAAIQLAHAGRKASTEVPWRGRQPITAEAGGWQTLAPSPIAFDEKHPLPRAMTLEDIHRAIAAFVAAAERAQRAGFEVVEIHAAHGYLLHEFLSPLSNHRQDDYGGALEN